MRIRSYRTGDLPTLLEIQREAARVDGVEVMSAAAFQDLLTQPAMHNNYYAFLITDDDDELNTWGQGETLEGVEGEVIGYTILQLYKDHRAYHFHSHGAVLPEHRQRGAGHSLLLCALNHARMKAIDILLPARQEGLPIYFDILLPASDPTTVRLAELFELEKTDEPVPAGMSLYRTVL